MIKDIFDIIGHLNSDIIDKDETPYNLPFINYYLEDKSNYKSASSKYNDIDADFLIGYSDGILMKIDFIFINTTTFSEVAIHFDKYGRYCDYRKNSKEYKDFWKQETQRRRKGMTANCKLLIKDIPYYFNETIDKKTKDGLFLKPLHITGSHYNYLNYSRIDRTRNDKERFEAIEKGIDPNSTTTGFPRFWDGDYWKFKLDNFILNNKLNSCDAKARRKGFSFKEGSDSANKFNLNPNTYIIHAAYDADKYLTASGKLTFMTKRNIDWYENNTFWKRGFVSEDLSNIISGYKKRTEGNKYFGFQSSITSVSLGKNTSAAAGSSVVEVKFEESGINPVLAQSLEVTMNTIEVGGNKVGTIKAFGTGGTKGANWVQFKNIYYNPKANNMLAMENIWDRNSRDKVCGFFFPNVLCYEPLIDECGNSRIIDSFYADILDKKEKSKSKKGEDLLIYIGQRANRPEEAFLTTIENIFTSPELTDQVKFVNYSDDVKTFKDGLIINDNGKYVFRSNDDLKVAGNKTHPYIETVPFKSSEDFRGCFRMFERPIRNKEGNVPEDIYFITYDTVKIDKTKDGITDKHSLNSFKVWKCPNSYDGNTIYKIIGSYCGRFDTLIECDKLVLATSDYYNCKVLFESGTGETQKNFSIWGKLHKLIKDPTAIVDQTNTKKDAGYGMVMGDGEKKLNAIKYLKEWLYTPISTKEDGTIKFNLHYIYDLPFLLELQNFDLTGNFDRISDALLAIYYILARVIKKKDDINNNMREEESLSETLNNFSL